MPTGAVANNGRSPFHCFHRSIFMNESNSISRWVSPAISAALLVSVLGLTACAGMTAQEKGTATGAVIGGVAGNVLCGGLACTGIGAVVGGAVGHEVTKPK
jgi:osmotically inducible lipoprotein OsmB